MIDIHSFNAVKIYSVLSTYIAHSKRNLSAQTLDSAGYRGEEIGWATSQSSIVIL